MRYSAVVIGLLVGVLPGGVFGQLGDEEDFPPGLKARFSAAGETIERIDPAVAFDWGKASPDPRLPNSKFEAEWNGHLLVREAGTYRISAYLQGEVEVLFDGQSVLSGSRPTAGWLIGKPFELRFGDQPIVVRFRKTGESAQARLFWSSESFPLEPLPSLLIYRDAPDPDLKAIETGRMLFTAAHCNRCHQREHEEPAPAAPALTHLKNAIDRDWLVGKLSEPGASPGSQMPDFGFTKNEAEAIAAFLQDVGETPKLSSLTSKDREKDQRAGQVLFRSVGCLACHSLGEEGQTGLFAGGDLSEIGRKRSENWLWTWLKDPEMLNPDHRMPLFKLSNEERRQLAVFLSGLGEKSVEKSEPAASTPEMVKAGRKLLEASGCAACHRIPNVEFSPNAISDLSKPIRDWEESCLSAKPDLKTHRPAYSRLSDEDREAIKAGIHAFAGKLSAESEYDRGERLLEQKNCRSCHDRNHSKGIVETAGMIAKMDSDLEGQSEALIPPALNAVGDKLLDEALAEAISGEQKTRMPWLKIRMPRFEHPKPEKSAIVQYLISHDRIPEGGPGSEVLEAKAEKSEALISGHELVGAKGFSCVACHRVGTFEPRNVALGTRGSDLLMLGKRMRKSFYLRWTLSPQRIVPGMEMPSVRKAVPGVLNEDLNRQLLATWDALNDPEFTAPTSPSAVEQLLIVEPGEPARIVRDVFTNPEDNGGGYVARAMAIGFDSGHNVLLDLDNFTLRNWTFGDFARQRTEGKSWYWDLAGVPVMKGFTEESDFSLQAAGNSDGLEIRPAIENNSSGRLLSYLTDGRGVSLAYQVMFDIENRRHLVHVAERVRPLSTGWSRELRFENLPDGYEMLVDSNKRTQLVGEPIIEIGEGVPQGSFVRAKEGVVRLDYTANLSRPRLEAAPVPEIKIPLENVTSVPGDTGQRLSLPASIMPTALAWTDREFPGLSKGTLVFTSLKGHVYFARDTDGDGLEDSLSLFEEGLAAPYGILPYKRGFLVSHKPEVVYLEDTDGDGRADLRRVVATGWGYSDNYHDWTTSLVRDSQGRFYVGLGSDYSQPKRTKETSLWRGAVLRLDPVPFSQSADSDVRPWPITPMGYGFRFPTGLAINHDDELFVTDNQGVQNTFNELNHIVEGRHYGVPSRHETNLDAHPFPPAVQIPHPWSRSVNGVFFLPKSESEPFGGHAIGCEYDTRFLVRLSLEKVQGEYQGAAYYFSRPLPGAGGENFLGPLCGGVSPDGDLYIGSIHDSGWLGGRNTGDIVRLVRDEKPSHNGIREVRITPRGFEIEFLKTIDPDAAQKTENYLVSGYAREWKGSYATPDSSRHQLEIESATLHKNGRTVSLIVAGRREGYVYEISCGRLSEATKETFFPDAGHYTLHRIPKSASP